MLGFKRPEIAIPEVTLHTFTAAKTHEHSAVQKVKIKFEKRNAVQLYVRPIY